MRQRGPFCAADNVVGEYLPVKTGSSVAAVFEIYRDAAPILAAGDASRRDTIMITLAAAAMLAVLLYLIFRGGKMHERALAAAQAQDAAFRQYVKETAVTEGDGAKPADELAKLEDLKRRGVISDAEFDRLKAKVVSG